MQNTQNLNKTGPLLDHFDEQILVVKRSKLFQKIQAWHGVNKDYTEEFLKLIESEKEFIPRAIAETDPSYKQIIPYLVFTTNDKYFLMQRRDKASEQRLKNKFSLGIGGHVRQEDISKGSIIDWARREFDEEINFEGNYNVTPLGIVNDDTNQVGEVHLGFAFLLTGNSDKISVKSELKSGNLYTKHECKGFYDSMESWSQLIFDIL